MKQSSAHRYHARMLRVLNYIDEHLADELSVDLLSGVAAFSKHHFHRQFAALFGMTVHRYVQLVRMKRASYRLAFREEGSVIEIALESGYESPEAFARAFKQQTGQQPTAFRTDPDWIRWNAVHAAGNDIRRTHMKTELSLDQIGLIDFPATRVAVLSHRGDPALIGASIRRFITWRKQVCLSPKVSATFNLLHADPDTAAPDDYRIDLCAATQAELDANEYGITEGWIPAGRCAVLRQVGSSDDLRRTVHFLYAVWLPQSGEELRDFPVFVQRVSFFPDVPEHEAITDVFLPLK